jgi:hypothetical protein
MSRKPLRIVLWLLVAAVFILNVRSHVLDFREFRTANPGSDFWGYLRDLSPSLLIGFAIFVGVYALVLWLDRGGRNAERDGTDDESKRLFREAHGD